MFYTFYLISHPNYPEFIYVGSTTDFHRRKMDHFYACYNENDRHYNIPLYQFIRKNEINFDEIIFEILDEIECNSFETARKWEQLFIDQFPNCLNDRNAYTDRKEYQIEYDKRRAGTRVEYMRATGMKWREKNKEKINEINEMRKIKIECNICGRLVRKDGLSKHQKTIICLNSRDVNTKYLKKHKNEIINCPICNKEISRGNLSRHKKSNICI